MSCLLQDNSSLAFYQLYITYCQFSCILSAVYCITSAVYYISCLLHQILKSRRKWVLRAGAVSNRFCQMRIWNSSRDTLDMKKRQLGRPRRLLLEYLTNCLQILDQNKTSLMLYSTASELKSGNFIQFVYLLFKIILKQYVNTEI